MYSHLQAVLALSLLKQEANKQHQLKNLFKQNRQHLYMHPEDSLKPTTNPQNYTKNLEFIQTKGSIAIDFSKHLIDHSTLKQFEAIIKTINLKQSIQAMLEGQKVNVTESRAAMHIALRSNIALTPSSIKHSIDTQYQAMQTMYQHIAQTMPTITDVIHLGVGGSDLGPKMITHALSYTQTAKYNVHYISNLDPSDLLQLLKKLDPTQTLIIACSKTFSTLETMQNLALIKQCWPNLSNNHYLAITANASHAKTLGFENILEFSDWVGGRFSLWSAVGFSIMLAYGIETFAELKQGANLMDEHFMFAPTLQNMPILMAVLGIYYRNGYDIGQHCIAAYGQPLMYLAPYLQQLEMESNGKQTSIDGIELPYHTAPIVFGEVGSTCQHSYFQLIHQSQQFVPVDFIYIEEAFHSAIEQHTLLNNQALAQAYALMHGQEHENPHLKHKGNRPSSLIILPKLNAFNLGQLIALYEHKIYVQSQIWRINPFDQWGVELGKQIAKQLTQNQTNMIESVEQSYDKTSNNKNTIKKKLNSMSC